jgi:hypothetical protein
MRYISYQDAERYSIKLAQEIQACLGPQVNHSRFLAIPRGGLIVLGQLSYLLALKPEQLLPKSSYADDLLVIVDDCSLSGARFGAFLERLDAQRVVFAHLLSPPELRQAILQREPRLIACLAADDLAASPSPLPSSPETEASDPLQERRYWLGTVEPFTFAWSEPDAVLRNQKTQQQEIWHHVSPRRSLDGRAALGIPFSEAPPGPLNLPEHIWWRVQAEDTYLWNVLQDRSYELKDVASQMWRALVAYGDLELAAKYLLQQYDVDETRLQIELKSFAEELLAKELLEYTHDPDRQ